MNLPRSVYVLPHWDRNCQIKLVMSPRHIILTLGQPVPCWPYSVWHTSQLKSYQWLNWLQNWYFGGHLARCLAFRVSGGLVGLVTIQYLSRIVRLICYLCISVTAPAVAQADPSVKYSLFVTGMLATVQQTDLSSLTCTLQFTCHWHVSNCPTDRSVFPDLYTSVCLSLAC